MKKLLVVGAAAVGALWLAVPAYADPVSDAVSAFQGGTHVYNNTADSGYTVDVGQVNSAVGSRPVYFAVFASGNATELAHEIGRQVPGARLVGVVAGRSFEAVSPFVCSGALQRPASDAIQQHTSELDAKNATGLLVAMAQQYDSLPQQCSNGGGSSGTAGTAQAPKKTSHTGTYVLIAVLLGLAAFVGVTLFNRSRKKKQELADQRAEVVSLYDRLGADVSNLDTKDNATARQALADASERYTAAGSQLAQARSPQQFAVAKRTALEGLYAARTARTALGLDPGPELPPLYPGAGQLLAEPTTLNVKGQEIRGYPDYQPGAPYYFGGGGGYGAGWYSMPFWETLLLASAFSGGFGGWGGGWGGGGFDSGYRDGYQDAQNDNPGWDGGGGGNDPGWGGGDSGWGGDSGGGSWGDSGGGDWGGGGDFGGGGGGDW